MTTMAELVRRRDGDATRAILFEEEVWTYDEWVQACAVRAAWLLVNRPSGPFHVGVLLDNVPEYPMWLGAAALVGATIVGINPTRRGSELARDITHTVCRIVITEPRYASLLEDLELGVAAEHFLVTGADPYAVALQPYRGASPSDITIDVDPSVQYLLIFTSGTTGAPKACICSQGRLRRISDTLATNCQLSAADVCYQVMPMFHSNALMAGWGPTLAAGATSALRRKFSASGFLPDVRRFGATYFNYVGKPLSYVLATPEQPDDADNPLIRVFGNEGAPSDLDRFAERFGCRVTDSYGSSEGGASVQRSPDMPAGALGMAPEGVVILNASTGIECPSAQFDDLGRLLNAEQAIGEIVNTKGGAGFEGYWNNDEANRARVRAGAYWTGDLGYRDDAGYVYFAGRDIEWLRVDGENFAAAPVERILARHPDVLLPAVYGVPDIDAGDRVMAAIELKPGVTFDPEGFAEFLDAQSDLGTKWAPTYVRICRQLPVTETQKVKKLGLRRERWESSDPVWWRPGRETSYRQLTSADVAELLASFRARGRETVLTNT